MPDTTACAECGKDANRNGLIRCLEWDGISRIFCSYLCEFLWRRKNKSAGKVVKSPTVEPFMN